MGFVRFCCCLIASVACGAAPGSSATPPASERSVYIVTVLELVGRAPGGETPRVADSSAAGASRFFHNSVPPKRDKLASVSTY